MPTHYSEHEQNMLADIEEHGFQSKGVFDPDGNDPNFCYSIGFTKTLEAPEFIVFGLDLELMHNMLWEVFRQVQAGAKPEHGMRWADVLEGFDCISLKADHPELLTEYSTSANWFWKDQVNEGHPPIYQLVWPGAQQGLFPWEEDCDPYVIEMQPKLWSGDP